MELMHDDAWDDAFRQFVHDRDNEVSDDAIALATVL
jgi:hypothetical protein